MTNMIIDSFSEEALDVASEIICGSTDFNEHELQSAHTFIGYVAELECESSGPLTALIEPLARMARFNW